MKVLVVDDSGVMRKIIIRALYGCGVTDTVEAADGQLALEVFQKEPFDLVLTDWNMPVMSGLEFVTAIRDSGSTVPVIMVTTEGEQAKIDQATQAGVTDYLCKPFDKDDLFFKLDQYVGA